MRIDWFLPALRKPRPGVVVRPRPFWYTWLKGRLPAWLFSDPQQKSRGLIRRGLRWIGISWVSSPIRRITQAVCFAVFLWLFFVVCWPYTARPAPPVESSRGWRFAELQPDTEWFRFTGDGQPEWLNEPGRVVYVSEEAGGDSSDGDLATPGVHAFRVASVQNNDVLLKSDSAVTGELIDRFLLNDRAWAIFERPPDAWPSHYSDELAAKEWLPADLFLAIDPLVSLSTSLASRNWVWSLGSAALILAVCVLVPRAFCGYVCPLGTLIDVFDWLIGRRIRRFRVADDGWWVHLKYYILLTVMLAAAAGLLVSGYVAAIPVVTRGMLFIGEPLQTGVQRSWYQIAPLNIGHWMSIALFLGVLGLGLLKPRFWCKYVCPSGAVFSLGNLFRLTERKVESSCIHCNKCVEICPFDAIKPDFTTRVTDCTLCQTCGGVCPTHAIKFVSRWDHSLLKVLNDPPTGETPIGRRGFISLAVGTAAAGAASAGMALGARALGAPLVGPDAVVPVRPPGSVPEEEFLEMCIRCGECFKVCPNNVLQAQGFQQGWQGLWTPVVRADWAGCESSCNACGQVCPTGAIRALTLDEKKSTRMGLAIVNQQTCLPIAGREACQLCVDECNAAGYRAIEFRQVHTQMDDDGNPIEDSGFLAPSVMAHRCVGCGLCQTRCYAINVKQLHKLDHSAIVVEAGEGKEDR
jgi:ferredoxin